MTADETSETGGRSKNRLIYVLLGIAGGWFGLHDFYAGYDRRGALVLLLVMSGAGAPVGLALTVCDLWFERKSASGTVMDEPRAGGVLGVLGGIGYLLLAVGIASGSVLALWW
ncbi:MAG: TM2 domain-containing protein [Victivallaceae bacterium]|nr:TM2 domain-containing protein [Victivallaceae bacterium]